MLPVFEKDKLGSYVLELFVVGARSELFRRRPEYRHIDKSSRGDVPILENDFKNPTAVEGMVTMNYDFDELAANRELKNMFFDLVDIHSDLLGRLLRTCETVQITKQQLLVEIE